MSNFPLIERTISDLCLEAGREVGEISADSRLREDLQFDSLELAILTAKIEAEFGVDIFEEGMVYTVGDVLAVIEGGQSENANGAS